MFVARCLGVSLAVFVLLYVSLSFAISRGWKLLWRVCGLRSPRTSADLLFALRVLPFAGSVLFTLMFTVPSFLVLEPRSTNEGFGTAPVALGLCCLVLLAIGSIRVYRAQLRTSQAMRDWLNGSTLMDASASVPVFQTERISPGLTVSGVCAPIVFVSEAAVAALSPTELRTALRHEMAHVRRYDNLKKIIFRLAAFPGLAALERTWSEQTEMAADDAAVSSRSDALDLAAALIKISKLGCLQGPELSMALLHSSTALSMRVQRLFAWDEAHLLRGQSRMWRYVLPITMTATLGLVVTYDSILTQMHVLTEWLVR